MRGPEDDHDCTRDAPGAGYRRRFSGPGAFPTTLRPHLARLLGAADQVPAIDLSAPDGLSRAAARCRLNVPLGDLLAARPALARASTVRRARAHRRDYIDRLDCRRQHREARLLDRLLAHRGIAADAPEITHGWSPGHVRRVLTASQRTDGPAAIDLFANLAVLDALARAAPALGLRLRHISLGGDGTPRSVYLQLADGREVRVSDHPLSVTPGRKARRRGKPPTWSGEVVLQGRVWNRPLADWPALLHLAADQGARGPYDLLDHDRRALQAPPPAPAARPSTSRQRLAWAFAANPAQP